MNALLLSKVAAVLVLAHLPGSVPPPVYCYPTLAAYWQDTRLQPLPPGEHYWPGGVAGAYGWLDTNGGGLGIALTPQECADLQAVAAGGGHTWQRDYAAFVLGHEITHAILGPDEHQADCGGLRLASTVLYLLGVRDRSWFAQAARELPQLTGTRSCG